LTQQVSQPQDPKTQDAQAPTVQASPVPGRKPGNILGLRAVDAKPRSGGCGCAGGCGCNGGAHA